MSFITDSGPAEIVRLSQKDDHFLNTNFRSQVTNLIQKFKGTRWWMVNHDKLQLATDFLYHGLTTLLGNQTLGEEYVNVIQTNSEKTKIPSTLRRLMMITLHVGGPYLLDHCLQQLRRTLTTESRESRPQLQLLLEDVLLPNITQLTSILHRCHLLIFYFQVRYYHFAKRITGIRYVLIRPWLEDGLSRWGYLILGFLSLIQLMLTTAIYAYSFYWSKLKSKSKHRQTPKSKPHLEKTTTTNKRCSLCLERLIKPTATPCGHIFCWQCILQSLQIKQQCPLCSSTFDPSRLIHLRNYNSSS